MWITSKLFVRRLIALSNIDQPVTLDKNKTYLVGKLLYMNAPNYLPFNLRRNEKMKISDFLTRTSSINFLTK